MIDLHTHSLLSDGVLLPTELVRRADAKGYSAIAITDHVDTSNIDFVVKRVVRACNDVNKNWQIKAMPGAEITHVPLSTIPKLVKKARNFGAEIVLVHGESTVEPVLAGTNKEALMCDIDILAHPGKIRIEDAKLARENGIFLEITSRVGHSLANRHIVKVAREVGAQLVLNTDAHEPQELLTDQEARKIALDAGLSEKEVEVVLKNSQQIVDNLM